MGDENLVTRQPSSTNPFRKWLSKKNNSSTEGALLREMRDNNSSNQDPEKQKLKEELEILKKELEEEKKRAAEAEQKAKEAQEALKEAEQGYVHVSAGNNSTDSEEEEDFEEVTIPTTPLGENPNIASHD